MLRLEHKTEGVREWGADEYIESKMEEATRQ
jgi:hypothetical protein